MLKAANLIIRIMRVGCANVQQNDFKMRAAFSHSLSSVEGQNASLASREEREDGMMSAQPRTLSALFLRVWLLVKLLALDRLRSQLGSRDETRCIVTRSGTPTRPRRAMAAPQAVVDS